MAITIESEIRGSVKGKPWTSEEIKVAVDAYFYMLRMQESGQAINKSEFNRRAKAELPVRSPGSLSKKYSNISAVLSLRGVQALDGYPPLFNYQKSLANAVERALANDVNLDRIALQRVQSSIETPPIEDYSTLLVSPPPGLSESESILRKASVIPGSQKDYLAREALNRSIGRAGENLVMGFEKTRLIAAGRPELAAQVEHVSNTQGDGLGYDIYSYNIDATPRLIEVKTTSYGIHTPILISANEIECSKGSASSYCIYRVFNIRSKPKLFIVEGDASLSFILEATNYRAWLRAQPTKGPLEI